MQDNALLKFVMTRHSTKPKILVPPAPGLDQLTIAARSALRAPDNGAMVPYRFVVVPEEKRGMLADIFASAAAAKTDDPEKIAKAASKAKKGAMLVGFIVKKIAGEVPVDEQLVTAGAALDQFLLALDAMGFGAITLSGSSASAPEVQKAFCREEGEELLAWITIGTPAKPVCRDEDARPAPLSVW